MQYAKGMLIGQRAIRLTHASWLPDAQPKALAILVHGYGEHMGRYKHVIEAMVEQGYAVHSLDHRGHGDSTGVRAHVERFDYFVDDLHLLVQQAKAAHAGLPCFMVAHSMGGLIGTRYALRHQDQLAGLILSGAAIQVGDDISPWIRRIATLIATLVPTLPITPATRATESVLSRDPLVQEQFDTDPLTYKGKLRARMGLEFAKAATDARNRVAELQLPLLVMHGAEDRLTNPKGSELLYTEARSQDKTLKLWPGCRHEILNEPEKDEVIAFMLDWLDQRVEVPAPQALRLQTA